MFFSILINLIDPYCDILHPKRKHFVSRHASDGYEIHISIGVNGRNFKSENEIDYHFERLPKIRSTRSYV